MNKNGLILFLITVFVPLSGHSTESHFAQWSGFFLQGRLSDRWGWTFDDQTRLNQDSTTQSSPTPRSAKGNRVLIRTAIRYFPEWSSKVQIHFGYGWTPNFSPSRDESRLYQQVQYSDRKGDLSWLARFCIEERFIELSQGTALRARLLGRLQMPVTDASQWSAVIWNELFQALNTIPRGPVSGFDQNRIFLGARLQMTQKIGIDMGYLNIVTAPTPTENDDIIAHTLLVALFGEL